MRATIRSLGVISLAALAVAAKGGAQVKLEFTPFAGSYKPTGNLLPSDALSDFHIINIHQNAGVALGGRVTAWLTDRFAVDGSFGYLGSDVAQTVDAPCVDICEGPVTSDTRGHMWLVSARLLVVVGHRPSSRAFYILGGPAYAGHGDKDFHYGYGSNAGGTMTRSPGAVVGIGARVEFPRTTLALRMHLEDYLYPTRFSGYDGVRTWSSSQIQNALLLSLGLSVRSGRVAARQR